MCLFLELKYWYKVKLVRSRKPREARKNWHFSRVQFLYVLQNPRFNSIKKPHFWGSNNLKKGIMKKNYFLIIFLVSILLSDVVMVMM